MAVGALGVVESFAQCFQRTNRLGFGEGASVPTKRPTDPERAAVITSDVDRLVGDDHGLGRASDGRQRPRQAAETDHASKPLPRGQISADLHPAIDPTTEEMRKRLQEPAPTVDERVVARHRAPASRPPPHT